MTSWWWWCFLLGIPRILRCLYLFSGRVLGEGWFDVSHVDAQEVDTCSLAMLLLLVFGGAKCID